jgi:Fe-S cluster biogenesis protein NfuA
MNELKDKIIKTIDKLRAYLQDDGGDMEYIEYNHETKTLSLKIMGACADCPMIDQTFDSGVKQVLLMEHPEIKEVLFI